MENLLDKLKSLGVQIGTSNNSISKNPPPTYPIEKVIKGEWVETIIGNIFLAESKFSEGYSHGNVNLHEYPETNMLHKLGNIDDSKNNWEPYIFIDAETSGLSGGTGTFIFLIGIGYFKDNIFHITQYFMNSPVDERAFINQIDNIFHSSNVIVSFNGKSFDIPLLKSRFILNHTPIPFKHLDHIDILHIARKLWKNRLPSRTLGDLEKEILHFQREQTEVPGWLVPQIYFDYLKNGDARPLEGVFYHNAMDVLTTAALFVYISKILSDPSCELVIEGLDLIAMARMYEEMGFIDLAIKYYESGLDHGLPEIFFISTLQRYANFYKKQGMYEKAVEIWIKSNEYNDFLSCIELAKYFEHKKKNIEMAYYWTNLALKIWVDKSKNGLTSNNKIEILRRLSRLEKRLSILL